MITLGNNPAQGKVTVETKRRLPGRPTTAAKPGQKSTLSLRLTAELKTRLDAAAKANDRPLSQEAEIRLEQSFKTQSLLSEVLTLAYGPDVAKVMLEFGEQLLIANALGYEREEQHRYERLKLARAQGLPPPPMRGDDADRARPWRLREEARALVDTLLGQITAYAREKAKGEEDAR
jgi:hypothetical protein